MKLRKKPYRGSTSYEQALEEIDGTWAGRAVLIDVKYEASGDVTPEQRQTMSDPGEPAHIEIVDETFTPERVVDVESGDDVELTDDLKAYAVQQAEAHVKAHRDAIDERWSQECGDAAEGAYWDAVDRAIDERKERGL